MSDKRYLVLELLTSSSNKEPFVNIDSDHEKLDEAYDYALRYFERGWGPPIAIIEVDMKTGVVKQIADKDKLYDVEKEEARK